MESPRKAGIPSELANSTREIKSEVAVLHQPILQDVLSKKRTGEQLKGSKIAKKASTDKFVM